MLGDMPVDGGDDVELRGDIVEGYGSAELKELGGLGPGAEEPIDEGLGGAEVGGPDDLGLAADALALAQVVVVAPADRLAGQAGHGPLSMSRSYHKQC
jgi:hypothetical protein